MAYYSLYFSTHSKVSKVSKVSTSPYGEVEKFEKFETFETFEIYDMWVQRSYIGVWEGGGGGGPDHATTPKFSAIHAISNNHHFRDLSPYLA